LLDVELALYALASVVWFHAQSADSVNTSHPLLLDLTLLFVTWGATLLFKEHLSLQKTVERV
jgi:hypothetical protein